MCWLVEDHHHHYLAAEQATASLLQLQGSWAMIADLDRGYQDKMTTVGYLLPTNTQKHLFAIIETELLPMNINVNQFVSHETQ